LRLRSDASELTGILNGIDEIWDPRACAQLAQPFGAGDWKGKQANADYSANRFGLALSRGPISPGRALVHQKVSDSCCPADEIIEAGGQIVGTAAASPRSSGRWSSRIAAGRCDRGCDRFNDGQTRRGFSPAAISR